MRAFGPNCSFITYWQLRVSRRAVRVAKHLHQPFKTDTGGSVAAACSLIQLMQTCESVTTKAETASVDAGTLTHHVLKPLLGICHHCLTQGFGQFAVPGPQYSSTSSTIEPC